MRKFSKVLESKLYKDDLENYLIDFKDEGYDVRTEFWKPVGPGDNNEVGSHSYISIYKDIYDGDGNGIMEISNFFSMVDTLIKRLEEHNYIWSSCVDPILNFKTYWIEGGKQSNRYSINFRIQLAKVNK